MDKVSAAVTAAGTCLTLWEKVKQMLQSEEISRKELEVAQDKIKSLPIKSWKENLFCTKDKVPKENLQEHLDYLISSLGNLLKSEDKNNIFHQLRSLTYSSEKDFEIWEFEFEDGELKSQHGFLVAAKVPDTRELWIALAVHRLDIKFEPKKYVIKEPRYLFRFIPFGSKSRVEIQSHLTEAGARELVTYSKHKALEAFKRKKIIDSITYKD